MAAIFFPSSFVATRSAAAIVNVFPGSVPLGVDLSFSCSEWPDLLLLLLDERPLFILLISLTGGAIFASFAAVLEPCSTFFLVLSTNDEDDEDPDDDEEADDDVDDDDDDRCRLFCFSETESLESFFTMTTVRAGGGHTFRSSLLEEWTEADRGACLSDIPGDFAELFFVSLAFDRDATSSSLDWLEYVGGGLSFLSTSFGVRQLSVTFVSLLGILLANDTAVDFFFPSSDDELPLLLLE